MMVVVIVTVRSVIKMGYAQHVNCQYGRDGTAEAVPKPQAGGDGEKPKAPDDGEDLEGWSDEGC
jgi:hypothetical protein